MLYLPAEHTVGDDEPAPQYEPAGHSVGVVVPLAAQYPPAVQLTHVTALEAPVVVLYVPGLQYTTLPPGQYAPATHVTHCDTAVEPAGEYNPAEHAAQTEESDAPTAELYRPSAQGVGGE